MTIAYYDRIYIPCQPLYLITSLHPSSATTNLERSTAGLGRIGRRRPTGSIWPKAIAKKIICDLKNHEIDFYQYLFQEILIQRTTDLFMVCSYFANLSNFDSSECPWIW